MFDELNPYGKHADFMAFYGDECDDPRDPVARRIAVNRMRNVAFGGKGGSAPNPNPGMIASAEAAKEIAMIQKGTADDMLNFYKQQYEDIKPILQQISQAEINMMEANQQRADEYANYERSTFRPLERSIVADAASFDTEAKREELAGKAAADVNMAFTNARGQENRALERMGVNPNSGRFAALNSQLTLGQTAALAGAKNQARENAEQMGFARKMDAAGLGRGLASNASTAYGVALASGDSAGKNSMAAGNFMGQGYAGAQQGYSSAASSYGTAGNIYGQEFQGRMQGYMADQQAQSALMGGLGQAVGIAGGIGLKKWIGADGGMVPTRRALKMADGGGVTHVGPGPVSGPGGPVDDKVPAMLSPGEYVLPADTTAKIGKKNLDKLVDDTHTPAVVQRAQKKRKAIKGKK